MEGRDLQREMYVRIGPNCQNFFKTECYFLPKDLSNLSTWKQRYNNLSYHCGECHRYYHNFFRIPYKDFHKVEKEEGGFTFDQLRTIEIYTSYPGSAYYAMLNNYIQLKEDLLKEKK